MLMMLACCSVAVSATVAAGAADEVALVPTTQAAVPERLVRKGYVPQVGAAKPAHDSLQYSIDPITRQRVSLDQVEEHMRISLLDPKWKEQKQIEEIATAHAKNSPLAEVSDAFIAGHPNRGITAHNAIAASDRAFRFLVLRHHHNREAAELARVLFDGHGDVFDLAVRLEEDLQLLHLRGVGDVPNVNLVLWHDVAPRNWPVSRLEPSGHRDNPPATGHVPKSVRPDVETGDSRRFVR